MGKEFREVWRGTAAEKKWRASLTRENAEGARLLAYRLRNWGVQATIKDEKARNAAREAAADRQASADARAAAKEAVPKLQIDASLSDSDFKARAGIKTRTTYIGNRKIEEKFDDIGNLVSIEETTL